MVSDSSESNAELPPPPPPPSELIAPRQPARSISGLTTAISILVPVTALLGLIFAMLNEFAVPEARAFLAGTITETEFVDAYGPGLTLQLVQSLAQLAAGLSVVGWMFRVATNHGNLGRTGRWRAPWAIGGWFVPPLIVYLIPFLMFRELWRASDDGDADWRRTRVTPLISVWFVTFGLLPTVLAFRQWSNGRSVLSSGAVAVAEQAISQRSTIWISALLSVASAVVFVMIVRQLAARHTALMSRYGMA